MTSLRLSYRRAEVAGFWIVAPTVLAAALAAASSALGWRWPWIPVLLAGVCLVLPALVWRSWREGGIKVWNGSMRVTCRALRLYVLIVCYHTFFAALGGRRNRLSLRVPLLADVSRWEPGSRAGYEGDEWWACLRPIVFLLGLLETDEGTSAPPSATYTLY